MFNHTLHVCILITRYSLKCAEGRRENKHAIIGTRGRNVRCCLWSVCLFRLFSVEQNLLITVTKFALQFFAMLYTLLLPMPSALNSDHSLLPLLLVTHLLQSSSRTLSTTQERNLDTFEEKTQYYSGSLALWLRPPITILTWVSFLPFSFSLHSRFSCFYTFFSRLLSPV